MVRATQCGDPGARRAARVAAHHRLRGPAVRPRRRGLRRERLAPAPARCCCTRGGGRDRAGGAPGSFKCVKTSEDGYEQVLAFAGPGEVLGFEAVSRGHHTATVIALEDSTAYCAAAARARSLAPALPSLDHAAVRAQPPVGARAGEVVEMMAMVAAETRLARFLVWLCGLHGRARPVVATPVPAHEPARHRQPARRGARDGEPFLHGIGRLGLPARGQPRGGDRRRSGAARLHARHARQRRRGARGRTPAPARARCAPPWLPETPSTTMAGRQLLGDAAR